MEQSDTLEKEKIHFAVMAIEAAAAKLGVSPVEMRRRLVRVDLLQRLIFDCYDVMHTQSLKHVAEDIVEALLNWEGQTAGSNSSGKGENV